jgi:RNA polymerase sigma-70 factor (ECF subfamily)
LRFESDEQLVERVQKREWAAFAEIYRRYRSPLYSFCLRMSGRKEIAEDALQDTFAKLVSHATDIRSPGALRGWLYRVARNEVLMMARIRRKCAALPDDGDEETWDTETPLTLLVTKDGLAHVEHCLARLKVEYREVILMREMEELSYAEIAAITQSTEAAVKSRLFKARRALARGLGLASDGRDAS